MDPYYFIEGISLDKNKHGVELHDIYTVSPDGSWVLGGIDGEPINYKDIKAAQVHYNNNDKTLIFFDQHGNPIHTFQVMIKKLK